MICIGWWKGGLEKFNVKASEAFSLMVSCTRKSCSLFDNRSLIVGKWIHIVFDDLHTEEKNIKADIDAEITKDLN